MDINRGAKIVSLFPKVEEFNIITHRFKLREGKVKGDLKGSMVGIRRQLPEVEADTFSILNQVNNMILFFSMT